MEKRAKEDLKEVKENITDFARRMRELSGLSDGNQVKSLKTVQGGESSFEGGATFYAKDIMSSGDEKLSLNENFRTSKKFESYTDSDGDKIYDLSNEFKIGPVSIEHFIELAEENSEIYDFLKSELNSNEGVDTGNDVFWGTDIFDFLKSEPRLSIAKENYLEDYELEDYELEDKKQQYGINPEIGDEFEIIDFEQEEIEEGENDAELYNLNENTIIVLDFLNEDFEVDESFVVHGYYTLGNSGGYEIMLSDDGEAARVRDAYGSDNPNTSEWFEIKYVEDVDGEFSPVIDPSGYNIPLNMVMRA